MLKIIATLTVKYMTWTHKNILHMLWSIHKIRLTVCSCSEWGYHKTRSNIFICLLPVFSSVYLYVENEETTFYIKSFFSTYLEIGVQNI